MIKLSGRWKLFNFNFLLTAIRLRLEKVRIKQLEAVLLAHIQYLGLELKNNVVWRAKQKDRIKNQGY